MGLNGGLFVELALTPTSSLPAYHQRVASTTGLPSRLDHDGAERLASLLGH